MRLCVAIGLAGVVLVTAPALAQAQPAQVRVVGPAGGPTFTVTWEGWPAGLPLQVLVCEHNSTHCEPAGEPGSGPRGAGSVEVVTHKKGPLALCSVASPCDALVRPQGAVAPRVVRSIPLVPSRAGLPPQELHPRPDQLGLDGGPVDVLANDLTTDLARLGHVTLSVTGWSRPAQGAVTCDTTTCTYVPSPGWRGVDHFRYEVTATIQGFRDLGTEVQVAAASVLVAGSAEPPPSVPEAPLAVLAPLGAGATVLAGIGVLSRRRGRARRAT